jgi:hypothetical protein
LIENAAAIIAAVGKQLSTADIPLLLSLLNEEAAFFARRMARELEPRTSYRDVFIGRRGSTSSTDGSSNKIESEQKVGQAKRGGDRGSSSSSGHGGWSAPVPTTRERYQQRIEKQRHRFPERPIHHRNDYNPSACQPGCYYHEEDPSKHDHRVLRGRDGRSYRRAILLRPAAARPAPPPPPQRSNDSSSSNAIPDAPPLDPDWQRAPIGTEMAIVIAQHISRVDDPAHYQDEAEAEEPAQQQRLVQQRPPLPASRPQLSLARRLPH